MNTFQTTPAKAATGQTYSIPLSALCIGGFNPFTLSDHLSVIVIYDGENIKVVHDLCPHMGGPLSRGHVCKKTGAVVCPWHGYQFSQKTLTLENNPNEKIWIQPLAGDYASDFETPKYKLRALAYRCEGEKLIIEMPFA